MVLMTESSNTNEQISPLYNRVCTIAILSFYCEANNKVQEIPIYLLIISVQQ